MFWCYYVDMSANEEKKEKYLISLSVRELVEFIFRSGDIDNRRTVSPEKAMQEGSRLHRIIQRSMGEGYTAEVMLKYDGYIRKQINEVEKLRNLENKKLSETLDYHSIRGLRLEARQKLSDIRPLTVGQASRISGVSPADINVLLIYLEKEMRSANRK